MQKIPFNKPPFVGMEFDYVKQAVESGRICGVAVLVLVDDTDLPQGREGAPDHQLYARAGNVRPSL